MTSTLKQLNAEYNAALKAASLTMRALSKAEDEHKIVMDLYRETAHRRHILRLHESKEASKRAREGADSNPDELEDLEEQHG